MQALSRLHAMLRWFTALVLLLWLTPSVAANSVLEVEPNNIQAAATPYAIGDGETRGQLSSTTDLDNFVFASTGGVITFSLRPEIRSYDGTSCAPMAVMDGVPLMTLMGESIIVSAVVTR